MLLLRRISLLISLYLLTPFSRLIDNATTTADGYVDSLFVLTSMPVTLIFGDVRNLKKRKAPSVIEISSDSSDVYVFQMQVHLLLINIYSSETVKAPVTPSKKRTRTGPRSPTPGTPEFDSLPAVSLAYAFIILAPCLLWTYP